MYWNRPHLPNRPILSISNLSPRNYDAGLTYLFLYSYLLTLVFLIVAQALISAQGIK